MPVDESIHPDNKGCEFEQEWIQNIHVIKPCVEKRAAEIKTKRSVKKQWQAAWLLRTVNCIDLTTLAGDDSVSNVERLCFKAVNPVRPDILESLKFPAITDSLKNIELKPI